MTAIDEVKEELFKARAKFANQRSYHEGYAVILEEVDELWDEVKTSTRGFTNTELIARKQRIRMEAIQVAAMAIRFVEDLCDN